MGTNITMRALLLLCIAAAVSAAPMINDQGIVDKINRVPGLLWKAGMNNAFNNMPLSSFKSLNGVKPDSWGMVQALPRHVSNISDDAIPESFDSAENWPSCAKVINDIRDQSMCGCCWAFAAASAASDRLCIATKAKIAGPISAQDVCFCASFDGCQGGQITTPWNHIAEHGVVTGAQQKFTGSGTDPDPFGSSS